MQITCQSEKWQFCLLNMISTSRNSEKELHNYCMKLINLHSNCRRLILLLYSCTWTTVLLRSSTSSKSHGVRDREKYKLMIFSLYLLKIFKYVQIKKKTFALYIRHLFCWTEYLSNRINEPTDYLDLREGINSVI